MEVTYFELRETYKNESIPRAFLACFAFSDEIPKIYVFNILSFISPVDCYILPITKCANE
jgi:hypothetical protein